MFPEKLTSKPVTHIHFLWFLLLHGEKKVFYKVLREDTSGDGSSVKIKTQAKTTCLSIVPYNRDKDFRDSGREQVNLAGQQEVMRYFDLMWILKNVKSHKRRSSVLKKRQAAALFAGEGRLGWRVRGEIDVWFSSALATEVHEGRTTACISSRKLKVELP